MNSSNASEVEGNTGPSTPSDSSEHSEDVLGMRRLVPKRAPACKTEFKSKNWCFTSFLNEEPIFIEGIMNYLTYQQEIAPSTNRKHWQCYVEFKLQRRKNEVKNVLPEGCHFEPRMGNQEQALTYCQKSKTAVTGTMKEWGIKSRQGNRSDLDAIFDAIESGMTMREIMFQFRGHGMRYVSHIWRTMAIVWGEDRVANNINATIRFNEGLGVGAQQALAMAAYAR